MGRTGQRPLLGDAGARASVATPAAPPPEDRLGASVVAFTRVRAPLDITMGIEGGVEPERWAAASIGIGYNGYGAQLSAMGRLRTPTSWLRGYVGAGVSVGRYQEYRLSFTNGELPEETVTWGLAELGAELTVGPALLRGFLGVSGAQTGYYARQQPRPYGGVGLGVRL